MMEKIDCKIHGEIDMSVEHVATAIVLHVVGVFTYRSRIYGEVSLADMQEEAWLIEAIDMATQNVDRVLRMQGYTIL